MQFAFFGSPRFAAVVLQKLIAGGFVPSTVVCNPDRPVGRKQLLTPPAVKQLIVNSKWQIETLQPEKLSLPLFATRYLPDKNAFDVFIVAAYAKIIPKEILALPRLGVIGVHPSLLPRHRGATPIQTAILEGDAETGTTLFLMDDKIDHGAVIAQQRLNLKNSKGSTLGELNYLELETLLAELSGELLVRTLPDFIAGKIKPVSQNDAEATLTKKFTAQDAFVDEKDLIRAGARFNLGETEVKPFALAIERKIRALNPEPGVWTVRNGKRIKLLEAEIQNGKLTLTKIQIEGKKPQGIG